MSETLKQLADKICSGQIDARTLTDEALDNAKQHSDLNLFTVLTSSPEYQNKGLLAGVPYLAKDAVETVELPTCGASPALEGLQVDENADVIKRLNGAGAVLIGKANMHELSFGVTSNNAAFGPVRNPHARDRIAGGSSGGSAAAVAAGIVPFAIAADTGGSARIPAALCGLFGFRPTTGRWPDKGLLKISPTRDSLGVIANHAEDVRLIDTILTDDTSLEEIDLKGLRLGLLKQPYMEDVEPEVAKSVLRFLDRLKQAGVTIVERDGSALHDLEQQSGFPIAFYEARIEMIGLARRMGCSFEEFASRIASPDVRGIVSSLEDLPDEDGYKEAMNRARPALKAAYEELFNSDIDALVYPTTALAAPMIGEDEEVILLGKPVPTFTTFARNTGPASVAAVPSISIPVGKTDAGLPIGMLLETRTGTDRRLLAMACEIDKFQA